MAIKIEGGSEAQGEGAGADAVVPGIRYLYDTPEKRQAALERARVAIKEVRNQLAVDQYKHFLKATRPSWRRGMP